MRTLRLVCRIIVGCLFIFSGFVKGVDPIGTQYRITDYFIAYNMDWAIPASLFLSYFLNMFEFLMGVLVLLNVRMTVTAWLVLLMTIFFTATTFYDFLYNPVPDCGCFGDAIKLTNTQTFVKNLILLIPVIIIFLSRKIVRPNFTGKGELIITTLTIILFLSFEIYNYRHLPVIDFSSWKKGTKLTIDNPKPLEYYVTYRNKETGEEKEYLSPNYPYNDSVWMSKWEYKENSQRTVDPNPKTVEITIQDKNRNIVTDNVLRKPEPFMLFVAYDLAEADKEAFKIINEYYEKASADGFDVIILTSTLPEDAENFIKKYNINENIEILYADDTSLQGIIRANPGLLLIKQSTILSKYHHRDFPEYQSLKKKIQS